MKSWKSWSAWHLRAVSVKIGEGAIQQHRSHLFFFSDKVRIDSRSSRRCSKSRPRWCRANIIHIDLIMH